MHDSHTLQKECFAQTTTCESISAAAHGLCWQKAAGHQSLLEMPWAWDPLSLEEIPLTPILPLSFVCAPVLDLDIKMLVISVSTLSSLGFSPCYFPHRHPNLICKSRLRPLWIFLFLAHWEGHSQAEKVCPWR